MQVRLLTLLLAASVPAMLVAAERPLVLDAAQSRISIAVHVTVDSFVGELTAFEPAVTVADDGRVTGARLAFHFRDVKTGKSSRDEAMHKWQHSDEFPDGLFVLTSIQPASGSKATAAGRLTLHGVTRDVTCPIAITREDGRTAIDGEATIDTREYGLPVIRMLAIMKVDPLVRVRFHLQEAAAPASTAAKGAL